MDGAAEPIEQLRQLLEQERYIAEPELATVLYFAERLTKPLLVEGQAGVGKTEIARVLSRVRRAKLVRVQCYEGIEASQVLYEWNYPKQMLWLRMQEAGALRGEDIQNLFSENFLLRRPLLDALMHDGPTVLLIDELDRADEAFEAFLLEVLEEFQITIPEYGTVVAKHPPTVILTSNRTRELSDALRRRCLYMWIDFPSPEKERAILQARVPDLDERLADQIVAFVGHLRQLPLLKKPGIAEVIDWALALTHAHRTALDPFWVQRTIGFLLKTKEDLQQVSAGVIERWVQSAEGARR